MEIHLLPLSKGAKKIEPFASCEAQVFTSPNVMRNRPYKMGVLPLDVTAK